MTTTETTGGQAPVPHAAAGATQVYVLYINAPAETVWEAITDRGTTSSRGVQPRVITRGSVRTARAPERSTSRSDTVRRAISRGRAAENLSPRTA